MTSPFSLVAQALSRFLGAAAATSRDAHFLKSEQRLAPRFAPENKPTLRRFKPELHSMIKLW